MSRASCATVYGAGGYSQHPASLAVSAQPATQEPKSMRGLRGALYPRSSLKVQLLARSGLAWDKARLGAV